MGKIILIVVIFLCLGVFLYFKGPKTKLENPFVQNVGKILGFSKDTATNKPDDLLTQTKDSFKENTEKNIETIKETVYNEAKTTLDNVFNKQASSNNQVVSVNILGVTNSNTDKDSIVIDLTQNNDLKLNLSLNKKYYLKFQNIPQNFCLYINGNKYPITDGTLEIQFTQIGNYPIKANSCDLNEKSIGTLNVE